MLAVGKLAISCGNNTRVAVNWPVSPDVDGTPVPSVLPLPLFVTTPLLAVNALIQFCCCSNVAILFGVCRGQFI